MPNIIVDKLNVTECCSSEEIREGQVDIPFRGEKLNSNSGVYKNREPGRPGHYFFIRGRLT